MGNIILRETPSELRAMARQVLKDNWVKLSIGLFIYVVLAEGISALLQTLPFMQYVYTEPSSGLTFKSSGIQGIYQLLTYGPLRLGLAAYLLTFMRTREEKKDLLLFGFMNFIPAFLLGFFVNLFTGLWMMLFIVPGIIAIYRYSQAFYILYDNPGMGPFDAIKASKFMTNGNKAAIFTTNLSFIGWGILATMLQSIVTTSITVGGLSISPVISAIISIICSAPIAVFYAYFFMTNIVMYEIMSGHLYKPQPQRYNQAQGYNQYQPQDFNQYQAQDYNQNPYVAPQQPSIKPQEPPKDFGNQKKENPFGGQEDVYGDFEDDTINDD